MDKLQHSNREIESLKPPETEIQTPEEILKAILDESRVMIHVIDPRTFEILYANRAMRQEFSDIIGRPCFEAIHNRSIPCGHCMQLPFSKSTQHEHINLNNGRIYLLHSHSGQWSDGRKVKFQIAIDVTEQRLSPEGIMLEQNQMLEVIKALLDATIEGLFIFDRNQKCVYANHIALNLFGYTLEEVHSKSILDFIALGFRNKVKRFSQNRDQPPYEVLGIKNDGSLFPIMIRGKAIELGEEKFRLSAVIDITKMREKENELFQIKRYDSLTSLPNRRFLEDLLKKSLHTSHQNGCYRALLFIGVDRFKLFNDSKGHSFGDQLLYEIAQRLKAATASMGALARFGGDEFTLLLEDGSKSEEQIRRSARQSAESISKLLQAPFVLLGQSISITASIGIISFKETARSPRTLIKYATSAMHHAKKKGCNTICFFEPLLQRRFEERLELQEDLRDAIDKEQLELFYQKQMRVNEQAECMGAEALLRWKHPARGFISPLEFIPLAEEGGYIHLLGEWVLKHALQKLQKWQKDPQKSHWRLSINISAKEFEREDFISNVQKNFNQTPCPPHRLCIELTEGILIQDPEKSIQKILALASMGILFSIDDFGTGYSSLQYLKKLPIQELKIDRCFIQNILKDEQDQILVDTMIGIGKKFNLNVVAEGVETQEQLKKLQSMGCELFQGFLFSKPSPVLSAE